MIAHDDHDQLSSVMIITTVKQPAAHNIFRLRTGFSLSESFFSLRIVFGVLGAKHRKMKEEEEESAAKETVARYMALSYGYNQSSFPGKETLPRDRVLSPEEEEFADADRSLEDLCIASRPGHTLSHPAARFSTHTHTHTCADAHVYSGVLSHQGAATCRPSPTVRTS